MRNVGAGERGQHARFAPHCLVRIGAKHRRRAAQDIRAPRPVKFQQDVLRAAGKLRGGHDRTAAQSLGIHPAGQRGKIDKFAQQIT
jgi:hypothetical protein